MQASLDQGSAPAPVVRRERARRARRDAWLPLTVALLCGAAYGLFFAVPYFVNDLDQVALTDLASEGHDPTDLWPYRGGGALAIIWAVGGRLTFAAGPFVAFGAAAWAMAVMWRDRRVLSVRGWLALGMAVTFGVAFWVGLGSPVGEALIAWYLD